MLSCYINASFNSFRLSCLWHSLLSLNITLDGHKFWVETNFYVNVWIFTMGSLFSFSHSGWWGGGDCQDCPRAPFRHVPIVLVPGNREGGEKWQIMTMRIETFDTSIYIYIIQWVYKKHRASGSVFKLLLSI